MLTVYAFPNGEPPDSARLAALGPETLRSEPGCDVTWTRYGDGFRGAMRDDNCGTEPTSVPTQIGTDEIWFAPPKNGREPYRLRRAHAFTGCAVVRADGTESEAPAPDSAFVVVRGLRLHDQGDCQRLVADDGRDLGITVELAQLVYQASDTAILKLALYRDGQDRALAYTWAAPGADRIGINLRWVQVGLTREPAAQAQAPWRYAARGSARESSCSGR